MTSPSPTGAPGPVVTARLELHALALPLLDALLAGDLPSARALAPFPLGPKDFLGEDHVLLLRREQLVADPAQQPWLLRAAVLRAGGGVVGRVGFHAPPDETGTVEIGYAVLPAWRRRGMALEMASAMLGWAATQGARRCRASISPGNDPSLAVAARLGFVRCGEQVDERDGPEWVFERTLDPGPCQPRQGAGP